MPEWAQWAVMTFGYWVVPLSIGLESLGVPLPAETTFLAASAFAAVGLLDIRLVIALAAFGAITGDSAGYAIGRYGGRALLDRYGPRVGLTHSRVRFIERFFAEHGNKTVFLGRFQFVLRTYAALFAGVARMPYSVFFRYNVAGGVCWALFYGILGYTLGAYWDRLHAVTSALGWGTVVVLLALCGALYWWRAHRRHEPNSRD